VIAAVNVGAFFRRDLRIAMAYPMNFVMQWVGVAVAVFGAYFISKLVPNSALFGAGGRHGTYFEYAVVNLAFFSMMQVAMQSVDRAIRNDQMVGTIEATLAATPNVATFVLASMLWPLTLTVIQGAGYLVLASLLFGGSPFAHVNVGSTLLCFLLIVSSTVPLGILSAAATLRFKQVSPSDFFVGGGMSLLSGVLFPVALLPGPLQIVSWLLPITHGLRAVREALAGAAFPIIAGDVVWLSVASVVLFPLSLLLFSRALRAERMAGTLAQY
jgi:ABC-2 type transport system permease protein